MRLETAEECVSLAAITAEVTNGATIRRLLAELMTLDDSEYREAYSVLEELKDETQRISGIPEWTQEIVRYTVKEIDAGVNADF